MFAVVFCVFRFLFQAGFPLPHWSGDVGPAGVDVEGAALGRSYRFEFGFLVTPSLRKQEGCSVLTSWGRSITLTTTKRPEIQGSPSFAFTLLVLLSFFGQTPPSRFSQPKKVNFQALNTI